MSEPTPIEAVSIVSLADFVAVDEPGAAPLVGTVADNLIPEGGDVMLYGDGGTAKTTLTVDLAFHLDAGQDWLGYPVARPARVLLIENEGPRALFRAKLRRKLGHWPGTPANIDVWERPWATFTFTDPARRAELARIVSERQIEVVMAGPVAALGMDTAGTLAEVRAFMSLVRDLREQIDHPLTVILVHHENKGGAVSGAWEGAGDTLLHTTAAGHGSTHVYVQKARWASASHHTTLKLAWADGEGFALEADRDLFAEIRDLLADGEPRTVTDIKDAIKAGKESVVDVLTKQHAEAFVTITGQAARQYNRSSTAKLYQLASTPRPPEATCLPTGPERVAPGAAGSLASPLREPAVRGELHDPATADGRNWPGRSGQYDEATPEQEALFARLAADDPARRSPMYDTTKEDV